MSVGCMVDWVKDWNPRKDHDVRLCWAWWIADALTVQLVARFYEKRQSAQCREERDEREGRNQKRAKETAARSACIKSGKRSQAANHKFRSFKSNEVPKYIYLFEEMYNMESTVAQR